MVENDIQNLDIQSFNLWTLAQLDLLENNLNCEAIGTVDELSKRFKVFY